MSTQAAVIPSEADAALAKETSRVLASHLSQNAPMRLRILDDSKKESTVRLPQAAAQMLLRILEEMARGNAVTLMPVHAELTTQQAADMLNISRPSLIRLLDEGKLRFRRVGTHRRVLFEDLVQFKRESERLRRAALDALAALDQELGLE